MAVGLILVVLLVGGALAASAVSAAGTRASSTSATVASTSASTAGSTTSTGSTTTTGSTATSGSSGSIGLYVGVLLLVVLFIGVLYGIDLVWGNRRQDKVLKYIQDKPTALTKDDRAELLEKLTDGTDGLVRALMALGSIAVFASALLYFLIRNPAVSNKSIVENAMTALVTLLTAITAFYFGTRAGQQSSGDGGSSQPPQTRSQGDQGQGDQGKG